MHGAATPSFDGGRRAVVMPGVMHGVMPDVMHDVLPGALTTPRLELAAVGEADLEELFALHADPLAFADDLTEPLTDREQLRWVLGQWISSWHEHGTGYLTVRARATGDPALPPGLLGVVGLTRLEHQGQQTLSAYWRLTPGVTGRGIAAEAMDAVLTDHRLGGTDHEVLAVTAAGNRPSRALAARLGFAPAPLDRAVPGGRDGDVLLIRPSGEPGDGAGTP